ncbi:MAG: hypothetical protein KDJ37_13740 [Hyphomicrobiaceae bacterium]|nr:hypothetical protein [Hyphomicrobiaceae bacterium]
MNRCIRGLLASLVATALIAAGIAHALSPQIKASMMLAATSMASNVGEHGSGHAHDGHADGDHGGHLDHGVHQHGTASNAIGRLDCLLVCIEAQDASYLAAKPFDWQPPALTAERQDWPQAMVSAGASYLASEWRLPRGPPWSLATTGSPPRSVILTSARFRI